MEIVDWEEGEKMGDFCNINNKKNKEKKIVHLELQ